MSKPFITSFSFGHPVHINYDGYTLRDDGTKCYTVWRFTDTNKLIKEDDTVRKCPKCNKLPTKDGHDPCIANLPGVRNACCGHGNGDAYIAFEDGTDIRGDENVMREVEKLKITT